MILVDTHILIWLALYPEKLSRKAVAAIENARSDSGGLAISAITLYEVAFLAARGRVDFQTSPESFLDETEARFIVKPITGRICAETTRLPDTYPKDPMDRIIGATAIVEGLTLITADEQIRKSGSVPTIW